MAQLYVFSENGAMLLSGENRSMRILFLIHSLGPGGAERVMSHLANGLASRGHQITICTWASAPGNPFFPLDEGLEVVHLGLRSKAAHGLVERVRTALGILSGLRKRLGEHSPCVVLSFIDSSNVVALLAAMGRRIPVVVSERSDPRLAPLGLFWRAARQLTYPWAAAIVVQSREMTAWLAPWLRPKGIVIPNPVQPGSTFANTARPQLGHRIIAVGRLGPEKGFDLLLSAFAAVAEKFSDWNLEIWGEGAERARLEALRDSLRLHHRVSLPGTTAEIHIRYQQSDLFVLSSLYEGFPNALCEAMAHGLPVIATSCSGGVREIIRPEVDGLLVPCGDADAMAQALTRLMDNPDLRSVFGHRAKEITSRFNAVKLLDAWEACLQQAFKST